MERQQAAAAAAAAWKPTASDSLASTYLSETTRPSLSCAEASTASVLYVPRLCFPCPACRHCALAPVDGRGAAGHRQQVVRGICRAAAAANCVNLAEPLGRIVQPRRRPTAAELLVWASAEGIGEAKATCCVPPARSYCTICRNSCCLSGYKRGLDAQAGVGFAS